MILIKMETFFMNSKNSKTNEIRFKKSKQKYGTR